MDQSVHTAQTYDFRQYDRIWQRVAPNLEPYPPGMSQTARSEVQPPFPAVQPVPPVQPETPAVPVPIGSGESQLPGAEQNPCCMGSAAAEMLEVLTGYIEASLSDRRVLQALTRQAPSWARQRLRDIGTDLTGHVRQLSAAYYLITGRCYRPSVSTERIYVGRWCPALRERYHAAACSGFNYARSADDTTDVCLAKLFKDLSEDAYRHAEELMGLLERSLQNT
ncbi:MAG: ferritin-like domain-containing protein [Oscillibacter sp.]|nr:ferritin-like domain-containing protein [Oscillibacter sp.]